MCKVQYPLLSSTWSYAQRRVVHMHLHELRLQMCASETRFLIFNNQSEAHLHSERAKGEPKNGCKRTTERIKWCLSNENENQSYHVTSRNTESTREQKRKQFTLFYIWIYVRVVRFNACEQKATKCNCEELQVCVSVRCRCETTSSLQIVVIIIVVFVRWLRAHTKNKKRRFNGLFLRHFFFVLSY